MKFIRSQNGLPLPEGINNYSSAIPRQYCKYPFHREHLFLETSCTEERETRWKSKNFHLLSLDVRCIVRKTQIVLMEKQTKVKARE